MSFFLGAPAWTGPPAAGAPGAGAPGGGAAGAGAPGAGAGGATGLVIIIVPLNLEPALFCFLSCVPQEAQL